MSRLRATAGRSGSRAPVVDPIACVGHGLCAELFPEGIVLDDWGYPIIQSAASDPALAAHARRAVAACPALALRLQTAHAAAPATPGRQRRRTG